MARTIEEIADEFVDLVRYSQDDSALPSTRRAAWDKAFKNMRHFSWRTVARVRRDIGTRLDEALRERDDAEQRIKIYRTTMFVLDKPLVGQQAKLRRTSKVTATNIADAAYIARIEKVMEGKKR